MGRYFREILGLRISGREFSGIGWYRGARGSRGEGQLDEQYTYSATQNDGRIASKIASGEEVVYQYDALQRLVSAVTVGPQWGMSWVYDGFGNRTAQQVVKGSVPVQSVSVDMATNRVSSWSYDANGNATSIPGVGGITYDASNRVKTVGGETYEYDPSNKRIWKNDTYTFWGARGERVGTYSVQLMQYLPEGQQTQVYQLSFVKGTEDWYFGGRRLQVMDRLGSANGTFYPYGEERTSSAANPADKFATYHRDGTGLDYADQRYYHAGSGRFVTSDPYGGSFRPSGPQSSNRYTYAGSDPVNNSDPSGLDYVELGPMGLICTYTMGELEGQPGTHRINGPCFMPGYPIPPRRDNTEFRSVAEKSPGELFKDALKLATKALEDSDCASIFGSSEARANGFDPAAMLNGQPSPFGFVIRYALMDLGGVADALTFPLPALGIREDGSVASPGGAIILINRRSGDFGEGNPMGLALTILHELGHAMNVIPGSGGSQIVYDGLLAPASAQDRNTQLVWDKCNKAIRNAILGTGRSI